MSTLSSLKNFLSKTTTIEKTFNQSKQIPDEIKKKILSYSAVHEDSEYPAPDTEAEKKQSMQLIKEGIFWTVILKKQLPSHLPIFKALINFGIDMAQLGYQVESAMGEELAIKELNDAATTANATMTLYKDMNNIDRTLNALYMPYIDELVEIISKTKLGDSFLIIGTVIEGVKPSLYSHNLLNDVQRFSIILTAPLAALKIGGETQIQSIATSILNSIASQKELDFLQRVRPGSKPFNFVLPGSSFSTILLQSLYYGIVVTAIAVVASGLTIVTLTSIGLPVLKLIPSFIPIVPVALLAIGTLFLGTTIKNFWKNANITQKIKIFFQSRKKLEKSSADQMQEQKTMSDASSSVPSQYTTENNCSQKKEYSETS